MVTDEMLAKACNTLCLAIANDIPTLEEELHIFSPAFERKMRRLIRKVEHPVRYRFGQIAASFLLIVFLGFASLMAFRPTVRAAVVGWVKETVNEFVSHRYVGETTAETGETEYYISGLSDDYTELHSSEADGHSSIIYANNNGETIVFFYSVAVSVDEILVVSESNTIEDISVNGHPATFYLSADDSEGNTVVWSDDESMTAFYISAVMEKEALIALAESVGKK